MYALIHDDMTGREEARFELTDSDLLDCDVYAERYADMVGYDLDEGDGRVPVGCGDFTVTIQEEPGSVVCWSSRSYFFEVA